MQKVSIAEKKDVEVHFAKKGVESSAAEKVFRKTG